MTTRPVYENPTNTHAIVGTYMCMHNMYAFASVNNVPKIK